MNTTSNADLIKCVYCGNYHTYSVEMCRDLNKPKVVITDAVEILKQRYNPSEVDLEIARLGNKVNEQEEIIIALTAENADLKKQVEWLKKALSESVKLQSHYAKLLNMHDGGERIGFKTSEDWINRLKEIGEIK